MKNLPTISLCLLLSGSLAASAQTTPKLALAGVEVTPTLAKKYATTATDAAASPQTANRAMSVLGVWNGTIGNPERGNPVTLTITKWPDGSIHAEWYNGRAQNQMPVTSIVGSALNGTGNHLKLTLGNGNPQANFVLMGDVDASFSTMQAQYIGARGRTVFPLTLYHSGAGSAMPTAVAPVTASTLEDLSHSINVQLFDHFSGEQFFSVMGNDDLRQAVPPAGKEAPQTYDLKNPTTAEHFKKAGINYLLVTSLEDYQDQTLEMRRSQNLHYQTQVYNQARRPGAFASAGMQTQGGLDPELWQRQIITLTVRCQLFDTTTGELKKSASSAFPSQRDYVAVAQGKNELSSADLLAAAAQKVSDWAAILVDDAIFPIEVLAKNDEVVTISRGTEGGLKEGQVFMVYVSGDQIKDPRTGKVLGRDLKMVGRVSITELQPKFSKARILEDTGIINGATLARKSTK